MTKKRINLPEALKLLKDNKLSPHHEIEYVDSDSVEATDAIKLGALGIDVPEEKIVYDDASIQEDDDFASDWISITSDLADYKKQLTIQLKVSPEVEAWLSTTNVDLDLLVSELITGFYRTTKVVGA